MGEATGPGEGAGAGEPTASVIGPRRRDRFTATLIVTAVCCAVAWFWFAIVLDEVWSEECKARIAGTTEIDLLYFLGVPPLVFVTVGAAVALAIAARPPLLRRLASALMGTLVGTVVGALVALWASGGTLFAHLAIGSNCIA
jgi:hypothetical protein